MRQASQAVQALRCSLPAEARTCQLGQQDRHVDQAGAEKASAQRAHSAQVQLPAVAGLLQKGRRACGGGRSLAELVCLQATRLREALFVLHPIQGPHWAAALK